MRLKLFAVVFTIIFVVGTSFWVWRWLIPQGLEKGYTWAYIFAGGPEVIFIRTGTKIRVMRHSDGGLTWVVYKHWLYGAKVVATGFLENQLYESVPAFEWGASGRAFKITLYKRDDVSNRRKLTAIEVDLDK